jgi:hypothetical protein
VKDSLDPAAIAIWRGKIDPRAVCFNETSRKWFRKKRHINQPVKEGSLGSNVGRMAAAGSFPKRRNGI